MANPELIVHVHTLLQSLIDNPYPTLSNPGGLQKRASVALIIRLSPSYSHWPSPQSEKPTDLDSFFSQPWTTHATPELLFIKRSARKGDRWTSHIALPGGKLDPTDPSDSAAAVRETSEEVGIDLEKHAIACGNLPQRLVTTHWGKKPLLVLCPFVFLLTSHEIPPLRLQPTEVASVHWVPLPSLRNPDRRTVVLEDVSSRLANQETGVKKWMLSSILGKMVFAAIALEPTESLHSRIEVDGGVVDNRYVPSPQESYLKGLVTRISGSEWSASESRVETPLLLWGLTLGVIQDFLDLVPPKGKALELWTYPTFTPLDVRFAIWLLTFRFKNRKRVELQSGAEFRKVEDGASFGAAGESVRLTGMDGSTECLVPEVQDRADETGLHGLGSAGLKRGAGRYKAAVTTMLEGWVDSITRITLPICADRSRYYELVRKAVLVALVGRAGMGLLLGALIVRAAKRRTGMGGVVAVGG